MKKKSKEDLRFHWLTWDSRAETDMNVVMTGTGGIIEVQGTAEGRPFTREQAIGLLDMAAGGIDTLIVEQSAVFDGIRGA